MLLSLLYVFPKKRVCYVLELFLCRSCERDTPYCLLKGGLQGGQIFVRMPLLARSLVSVGFYANQKTEITDFPPCALCFAHQLYSKYPALLITSSSIRILDTTLRYLVYFFFPLRNECFYVLGLFLCISCERAPPHYLHFPYQCCDMGTPPALCRFGITVCHWSSRRGREIER